MLTREEIEKARKSYRDVQDRLPFVLQALADQTRLKIFQLLSQNKDLCVTDIAKIFRISVPATSYQLKIMEVVGLVQRARMGRMICYTLKKKDPLIKSLMRIII